MSFREEVVSIACQGDLLLGLVSSPAHTVVASGIGVVIVVGGPQYRVGSHRQFVSLARALANAGHHCLRFDYRGMGDSTGTARDFEAVGDDIHAAVAALQEACPSIREIVLWGLCDGASACLLYLEEFGVEARVDRLCLFNPWVRSASGLARTQVKHYYVKRLRKPEFWRKLFHGGTGMRALREFAGNLRLAVQKGERHTPQQLGFQERMAAAWKRFPGPTLLVLSGDDYVAKEFLDRALKGGAWSGLLGQAGIERRDVPGVDHTFSSAAWRAQAEQLTTQWLAQSASCRQISARAA